MRNLAPRRLKASPVLVSLVRCAVEIARAEGDRVLRCCHLERAFAVRFGAAFAHAALGEQLNAMQVLREEIGQLRTRAEAAEAELRAAKLITAAEGCQ